MKNEVRFAPNVKDLNRRVQFAMQRRAEALDRRWEDWMKKLARDAGLKAV